MARIIKSSDKIPLAPRWLEASISLDLEKVLFVAIVLGAAFLRFWDLGGRPLQHLESIRAYYAYKIFMGGTYRYDPAYHGPLIYFGNALTYFSFGASDFSARLIPAILGTAMPALCWLWKPWLGRIGALTAAIFMTVSPNFIFQSRFLEGDIYVAFASMLVTWGLLRYLEAQDRKHLFIAVAGGITAFCSEEKSWILLAAIAFFLVTRWIWERRQAARKMRILHQTAVVLTSRDNFRIAIFAAAIFWIPFTLFFSSFLTDASGWWTGLFDSATYWIGEQRTGRGDQPFSFYILLLLFYELGIFAFALLGAGLILFKRDRPPRIVTKWAGVILLLATVYVLQAHFPRSPKAFVAMTCLSFVACSWMTYFSFGPEKNNMAKVFLVFWSTTALLIFSLHAERMPWTTIHMLVPLALLAGLAVNHLFSQAPGALASIVSWSLPCIGLAAFLASIPFQFWKIRTQAPGEIQAWLKQFAKDGRFSDYPDGSPAYSLLDSLTFWIIGCACLIVLILWLPKPKAWVPRLWAAILALAMLSLLHSSTRFLFGPMSDTPAEPLLYVQTGQEVPKFVTRLQAMSVRVTGGPAMKVAVEDLASWPLAWYMRDMPRAEIGFAPPLTLDGWKKKGGKELPAAIITGIDNFDSPNHDETVSESLKTDYVPQRIKFRRWWGPSRESITGPKISRLDATRKIWRLYAYAEPWMPEAPIIDGFGQPSAMGSFDVNLWIRKDLEKYY